MNLPNLREYRRACSVGLSAVRPLRQDAPDPQGWNFQPCRPPSYQAYGRMRALLAINESLALKPKRVLEVAAGDAALSATLAMAGCSVTANDLRADSLRAAVNTFSNADAISILSGNLFDLKPEESGLFDLVVACEIIEHVAYSVDFLTQLKCFLAPGGRILLTTPNGLYFHNKLPTYSEVEDFTALEASQFKPDADGHLFLITPSELCEIAHSAGLRVQKLDVWGTPIITGHVGFRLVRFPLRWCHAIESACRHLPLRWLERITFNLSAVLGA